MKKDIEWIKNKLFEVAGEENKSQYLITLESVYEVIDQLDEPEVLSQEWIDEHKESRINNLRKRTTSDVVPVDDLQNLIVPNQEPEVTLDKAFEKISELYPMTKEEIWKHLEQNAAYGGRVTYGEPEVLSQEWIDDKTFVVTDSDGDDYAVVGHASLKNLIIPKQEITEEQVMDWLDKNDFYDHITAETVLERAVDKGELTYYGTKYSVIETPIDEPEVTLDRAFEEISQSYPVTKEEIWRHVEQIVAHGGKVTYGEQEVLSQELPVIPKFIANFIEARKHVFANTLQHVFYRAMENRESEMFEEEHNWVRHNSETFARAWLDGYTVEEPLYYALIKGHELVNDEGEWSTKYWNLWVSEGCVFPHDKSETTDDFSIIMSKEDWNKYGINDLNADFIKVEDEEK